MQEQGEKVGDLQCRKHEEKQHNIYNDNTGAKVSGVPGVFPFPTYLRVYVRYVFNASGGSLVY